MEDVEEAIRLSHMSKASLQQDDFGSGDGGPGGGSDLKSRVFGVMRDAALSSGATSLNYSAVEAAVTRKGFSQEAFFETIEEYTDLGIIQVGPHAQL